MPKRTLALTGVLIIVAAALVAVALSPKKQGGMPAISTTPPFAQPSPTPFAQTTMNLSPATLTVAPGNTGTVTVNVNTGVNAITAVQLDMTFDPKALSNIKVTAGQYFQNPFELLPSTVDSKTGKISYALGLPPSAAAKKGIGTVATITFTSLLSPNQQTQLTFTSKTLVTAEGVSKSVLKSSVGATIVGGTTSAPAVQSNPATPAQ